MSIRNNEVQGQGLVRDSEKALACAVLERAVWDAKMTVGDFARHRDKDKRDTLRRAHEDALRFLSGGPGSMFAFWCDAAGFDHEAITEHLQTEGVISHVA